MISYIRKLIKIYVIKSEPIIDEKKKKDEEKTKGKNTDKGEKKEEKKEEEKDK